MVRTAVRRTSPRNRSAMPGGASFAAPGRVPFVSLGHFLANPEDEQGRQDAHEEDHAGAPAGEQEGRARGQEDADVDTALEHGGDPGPPAAGPGLRQQRGADGPLAADAERGQESDDEQLPPRVREEGKAGEQGVGEDRQAQRPAPADAVADAPEETAPNRPADQERGLDPGAVPADVLIPRVGGADQLGDEGGRDQDVKVHVQAVEQPAEPGGEARLPLVRREVAQALDLVAGWRARSVEGHGITCAGLMA